MDACFAWAREVEAIYQETGASAAGTALASTFYALAENFLSGEARADYRERVRQLSLEIIGVDPAARDAYLLLSHLHEGEAQERIEWLRKAVDVDESGRWLRYLVDAYLRLQTLQGALDAVVVAEDAYFSEPPGERKWEPAALVWSAYYQALDLDAPTQIRRDRDDFVARVRADSDWDAAVRGVNYLSDDPLDLRGWLHTVCGPLASVFGDSPCIFGLHSAMHGARTLDGEAAKAFAETAAQGMARFRVPTSMVERRFTWSDEFRPWLEELIEGGFASIAVYEALERMPGRRGLLGILDARLAIIEFEPNSGEARFGLGKAYFDARQWESAIAQFEIARTLLTEIRQYELGIPSYLRTAAYELEQTR